MTWPAQSRRTAARPCRASSRSPCAKSSFTNPVFVGDLVSFYAETVRIGTTSITIRVVVEAERYGGTSRDRVRVTEAEVVYVAVDEKRKKTKIVISDK